jgi:hypothetical protein
MEDDPVAQTDQDIVRGHKERGYPQAVLVRANGFNGGWTQCTGTYVADRVVVTAAHCMRNDQIPGQLFVYHGKDYLDDQADLPNIPAPGERSSWARAETWVTNPSYDASVSYPDMTVLFLDRELPFAPIPLKRSRVSDSQRFGTIVGWGGKRALTADISQVEGAGIKRSAKVRLLGSPTEDDFHEDDPNPGILDPEIRADLLKTNGEFPRANACAGDSGGPLFVEKHGREYLAGIGFWTGLWCEDYSMFTRIDPFLDFFDAEFARAGKAAITPRLECVEERADGSLAAHFGYQNDNGLSVNIRYGRNNSLPGDESGARPTRFAPGNNAYDFSVPFDAGETLTWRLDPHGSPATVVTADASSPRCAANDPFVTCAAYCDASLAAECADPTVQHGSCVQSCASDILLFEYYGCGAQLSAFIGCGAGLSPSTDNWDCSVPGFPPSIISPPACEAELNEFFACLGY